MRTHFLNKSSQGVDPTPCRQKEAGSSMLEMVVAMVLLTIGLLALEAALAWGVTMTKRVRNLSDSKQTITSMLEQIETLRNTKQLTFGQIANAGYVDNSNAPTVFAGFPTGFQPVSVNPGPDGVFGTGDDLIDAGPDATYGTFDDITNPAWARDGYTRQIAITSLSANLKKIVVTMRYPGRGGDVRELVGISYLNNDARSNYR